MEKLLVTPKNKSSIPFLKKLLEELGSVGDVEIFTDNEVKDDELLRRMKKNLKGGYTSREKVMTRLDRIISKK